MMNWTLAAATLWTVLIIGLCSIPAPALRGPDVAGVDKLAHFVLFGIFAWLWLRAVKHRAGSALRHVVLAGLALAGLTEVYQGLLPFGRDPSLLDALANTAGLLVGIAVHTAWERRTSRRDG